MDAYCVGDWGKFRMRTSVQTAGEDRPDTFRLEEFLPYRLSVAADSVSRMIARLHLGETGLGMPEWRLLAAVGRHGVLSPTLAGEQTSMDKVKVSRAAASLAGRGLLRQSQDPNDGRGRLLRLTRKGATVYANIAPMAEEIDQAISSCLTRSERTVLQKALVKLIEHTSGLLNGRTAGFAGGADFQTD